MQIQAVPDEIHTFFQAYNQAFATIDGRRIAAFYHAPCVTVRVDGSIHCLQRDADLRQFFQEAVDVYRLEGYEKSHFLKLETASIGSRSILATMDWELMRSDDSLIHSWRQSYNLVRIGEEWKILLSTFHI